MGDPPRGFDAHVSAAREVWPDVEMTDEQFVARLGDLARDAEPPPVAYAADVFIAHACALRIHGAVAALDRAFFADVARAIRRIDGSPAFGDEALQAVREKLFVAENGPPKIAEYAGRAALRTWLSAVAVRTALNLRRRRSDQPHEELRSVDAPVSRASPELDVLRTRYKIDLEQAIVEALASLTTRERTLLRLHLAERLSIDRLATIYHVGRSTAARWLAAARETLAANTRDAFCARAKVTPSEFDSVAAALRSDLDVSVVSQLERLDA